MIYAFSWQHETRAMRWLAVGLEEVLKAHGHRAASGENDIRLVVNFVRADRPEPYRRKAQATFVVSVVEVGESPADVLKAAYPLLVQSLSNLLIYIVARDERIRETYFVTLERGYYRLEADPEQRVTYFERIYERLLPLASSRLVIKNEFRPDLPSHLWEGDRATEEIRWASRKLEELDLLPAPFPIQQILSEKDFRHVQHLYGIGGLSYGNLSARQGPRSFWMSASGVNKARLSTVGRDILLVTGYDPDTNAMILSVPPHVEPRRVSVDAIEHWMIYTGHPQVGAIVHIHAWMEGIPSTEVNYPCGTYELASAVARLLQEAPDPGRAVVGLKNHGLTITGPSLREIFERIEGKILRQVPMS